MISTVRISAQVLTRGMVYDLSMTKRHFNTHGEQVSLNCCTFDTTEQKSVHKPL